MLVRGARICNMPGWIALKLFLTLEYAKVSILLIAHFTDWCSLGSTVFRSAWFKSLVWLPERSVLFDQTREPSFSAHASAWRLLTELSSRVSEEASPTLVVLGNAPCWTSELWWASLLAVADPNGAGVSVSTEARLRTIGHCSRQNRNKDRCQSGGFTCCDTICR